MKNKKTTYEKQANTPEYSALRTLSFARNLLYDGPRKGFDPHILHPNGDVTVRFAKEPWRVVRSDARGINNKSANLKYVDVTGLRYDEEDGIRLSVSEVTIVEPSKGSLTAIDFLHGKEAGSPLLYRGSLSEGSFEAVGDPAEQQQILEGAEELLERVSTKVFAMPDVGQQVYRGPRTWAKRGLPSVGVNYIEPDE